MKTLYLVPLMLVLYSLPSLAGEFKPAFRAYYRNCLAMMDFEKRKECQNHNWMDFYPATSGTGPRPVMIYSHGGAWLLGDPSTLNGLLLKSARGDLFTTMNAQGIHVIVVEYRYIWLNHFKAPRDEMPVVFADTARAIQYVRSRAKVWNIDPTRVGLIGESSGAFNSLWVSAHSDLAKSNSSDPVERESTRVKFAVLQGCQTTLTLADLPEALPTAPDIWRTLPNMFDHQFYEDLGIDMTNEVANSVLKEEMPIASPINHVTADDPPYLLQYYQVNSTYDPADTTSKLQHLHHPSFGEFLIKKKLKPLGMEYQFETVDKEDPASEGKFTQSVLKFIADHL